MQIDSATPENAVGATKTRRFHSAMFTLEGEARRVSRARPGSLVGEGVGRERRPPPKLRPNAPKLRPKPAPLSPNGTIGSHVHLLGAPSAGRRATAIA